MKTNDMLHRVTESGLDMERVVLPDDENHPLLNRQIVYTGITRAKKRAVIVGMEAALTAALSRKIERDTGVSLCKVESHQTTGYSSLGAYEREVK